MDTFRSICLSSCCLLFVFTSPAKAALSIAEADELLLFQDMDLVVSASRLEQPKDQLSVPVTVLSSDDLHYGCYSTVAEVLRFVPGIDVIRMDRSRYGVGIHGLEGLLSDRMMTLVDGMPADSPAFGGPEFSLLAITLEDIERIEVVRGSGGAAWGANALSGVVNIITKKPGSEPGVFVSTAVSEFGDNFLQARYSDANKNLRWLLSTAHENIQSSEEVLDLGNGQPVDDFARRTFVRSTFEYNTDNDLLLSFGASATEVERGGFEISSLQTSEDNSLQGGNGHIKVSKKFSSTTEAYVRWAGRFQDMDLPSYGDVTYTVRENDIEGQINYNGLDRHAIAVGGNMRCSRLSSRAYEYDIFTLVDENVYERWAGLFGLDRYQYSKQLALETQLRVDYFSEGDADWSGRISSIYAVDAAMDHVVRVSAAKSYRMPVGFVRNAVYDSSPGTLPYEQHYSVDPDMSPEEAWSIETGYSWNIFDSLTFQADFYYMWYQDLIGGEGRWGVDSSGNARVCVDITNTGDADGYGGEIQLEYQMADLL